MILSKRNLLQDKGKQLNKSADNLVLKSPLGTTIYTQAVPLRQKDSSDNDTSDSSCERDMSIARMSILDDDIMDRSRGNFNPENFVSECFPECRRISPDPPDNEVVLPLPGSAQCNSINIIIISKE